MTPHEKQAYDLGEMCVCIHQAITEDVFRGVESILTTPLGRFKSWSEVFVFTPRDASTCEELLEYLRRSNITHSVEIEHHWIACAT